MSILSQPAPRRLVRTACMQSLQPVRAWTGHTAPPRLFDIVLIIDINTHVNCRCWWILKGLQQEVLAVTPSGDRPSRFSPGGSLWDYISVFFPGRTTIRLRTTAA
jgi:hypothetical protein